MLRKTEVVRATDLQYCKTRKQFRKQFNPKECQRSFDDAVITCNIKVGDYWAGNTVNSVNAQGNNNYFFRML